MTEANDAKRTGTDSFKIEHSVVRQYCKVGPDVSLNCLFVDLETLRLAAFIILSAQRRQRWPLCPLSALSVRVDRCQSAGADGSIRAAGGNAPSPPHEVFLLSCGCSKLRICRQGASGSLSGHAVFETSVALVCALITHHSATSLQSCPPLSHPLPPPSLSPGLRAQRLEALAYIRVGRPGPEEVHELLQERPGPHAYQGESS